jgi:integrase/recombinase XerD
MTLAEHPDPTVNAFLAWSLNDRNRSPRTVERYAYTLAQLPDPLHADLATIEAWWGTRLEQAPATRANELACLRSYYRWCTKFDHRADDPTRRLDAPKVPNRLPRPIGEVELAKLVRVTEDIPDLRRAIALGAYAGMRVSEAATLDWADVDQERHRLFIRGKGQKERPFALSPVLLDKLLPDVGGNVVTAGGKPYNGPVLQRKVNRLMQRHGINHTFHDLRKRSASLAVAKVGVYEVSKAFGWASIETASAYAVVSNEALDAIAAAVI